MLEWRLMMPRKRRKSLLAIEISVYELTVV